MSSIINRFISALREYNFILNRDFSEIVNVAPHKREIFINKGVKIFLSKVLEEMQIFHINLQHQIDTKPTEAFMDLVVSLKVYREKFTEYVVFSPIKGHIFYTDNGKVYFNNRIITFLPENKNQFIVGSSNILFLHNLYPCYMLLGCFKEITINNEDLEKNKYALEILKNIETLKFEQNKEYLRITPQ